MYGKLKNGALLYAPSSVMVNDKRMINPSDEILRSLGWLPIVMTPRPQTAEGYIATAHFEEITDSIVQVWTVTEIPFVAPTTEERLEALESAVLEIILGGVQ